VSAAAIEKLPMSWFKRFVWWKCAFWFALGAGLGGALSIVLPDPGPGSAKRIPAEQFVSIFQYPILADGEHISEIVVYPAHDGVELLMFDLNGKQSVPAYVYAQQPFITVNRLKTFEQDLATRWAMSGRFLGTRMALIALQMQERQAHMDAFRDWASAADFLEAMQTAHPNLLVRRAWWADRKLQRWTSISIGFLVVGAGCSILLARRTKEQQTAHELMSTASQAPALPSGPAAPSEEDLRRVRELDEALAKNLAAANSANSESPEPAPAGTATTAAAATVGQPPAPVRKFTDQPLEAPVEATKEEKDYAGDFYPTERRVRPQPDRTGFSLVEMLVAIGIIAVIMAILLPALIGARRSADTIACAANLHSIAQGLIMYTQSNQNTYPAAYLYINQQIVNGVQTPNSPAAGYVHWSSYLYGNGSVPAAAFTCPTMDRGGLPPTNTTPDNMNTGQVCPGVGVVDQQAPRLAYTVNEALCPRNKFVTNFQSAQRIYRYVKANEVADPSNTILAMEMIDNGTMLSYNDSSTGWIMSHRPIDGFCNSTSPDVYLLPIGAGFRPSTAADIDPDPSTETSSNSRLDLVGRNHGPRQSYPDHRLSNFAYCDGHVETKSIYDTVGPAQPFQWGAQFYSLVPNNDEQP
jgi:prepilin-type N-terminal cleavage/methylation domain-containing protein/prepilin-type processing-associated H-X9-DG protein